MSDPTDAPRPGVPLSILDLAAVGPGESIADSFAGSRPPRPGGGAARLPAHLVRRAPQHPLDRQLRDRGPDRPHRRPHRADPARRRRRHAAQPLAAGDRRAVRHPGRAPPRPHRPRPRPRPGSDTAAMRALRRDELSSERFPQDVVELQDWLGGRTARCPASSRSPARAPTCRSTSSAPRSSAPQLAAVLGLPYAFASHFAPAFAVRRAADLPRELQTVRAARRALRDGRDRRDRRRRQGGRRGAARDHPAACGSKASSSHRPAAS